jgi:small subunit ribosomal protein S2
LNFFQVNDKKEDMEKEIPFNLNIEEMAKVGLHFGHKTSKVHPKMFPFIFGVRNNIHIIDLEKTKEKFEEALKFIQNLVLQNKVILFVGTKPQIKDLVKEIATELGFPYVNERWLGGTFTNFEVIKKRAEYLKDLEKKKAEGFFEKYTKKERAEIEEKIEKLQKKFGGIKNLEKLPDAIFVCDMVKDKLAVKEAREKGVKIIAISDTNADPTLADYPIPANDDAISSVKYILEKVKEVILKIKQK